MGVSRNKLYQPTQGTQPFRTWLMSRQQPFGNSRLVADGIVGWLQDFASFFTHDPTGDKIFLPYATHATVYDIYTAESLDKRRKQFFVRDEEGTVKLASRRYFMHVWTTDERVKHIVTRKFLR